MKSLPSGLQEPRIRQVPDYISSLGQQAIEVAELAGLHLDPWQQLVLMDGCSQRSNGKWAAFEVGMEVGRQNGKGSILEARELAGAFAFGERLIIHSAHEQITSSEHFRRLLNLIEGVPEFERRVLKVVRGKGSEAIELRGNRRIMFKTRTGGGGRGLTGDLVVLDEAMILTLATMAALVPTMAARSMVGNPQLWYAGSAVDQEKHEHGVVFTRLRARALQGAAGIAYLEWSGDVQGWLEARGLKFDPKKPEIEQITPEMLADPAMHAQANPGLGIRITHDYVLMEHGALPAREFAVERLGIGDPPPIDELEPRVIPEEVQRACEDPDSRIAEGQIKTFAVDVSPDRTWGSISVAGKRADGLEHIEVVDHRRGTGWLLKQDPDSGEWSGRLLSLHEKYEGCRFAIDARGPAAWLIQPMKDLELTVLELSTQDYAIACGGLFDAFDQGRVRYPAPQPELDEAFGAAKTAPMGDAWKWSRRQSTGADITPLVSCTLALWGSETQPIEDSVPLLAWR